MKYMRNVAELLGVEIGEEFDIKNVAFDELLNHKYKFTDYGLCIEESNGVRHYDNCAIIRLLNGELKICKPILDDVEKKYLSRIIRPWRDKVEYIRKINFDDEDEFIVIIYRERESKAMPLPCFKKGTMYKGMEVGKEYSLEDLGL